MSGLELGDLGVAVGDTRLGPALGALEETAGQDVALRPLGRELILLPDEPYAFSPTDGPEAFDGPAACVSGRHLTWYGPSLVEARQLLTDQLAEGVRSG